MKTTEKSKETTKYCVTDCKNGKEELSNIIFAYIEYYHNRSNLYKYVYRSLSVIRYTALAAIPVIQAAQISGNPPWVAAAASSLCILIDSVIHLFQMKEKWILYRNTNCKLMSEQRQYALCMGTYYGLPEEQRMQLYIQRLEKIVGCESQEWKETVSKPEKQS